MSEENDFIFIKKKTCILLYLPENLNQLTNRFRDYCSSDKYSISNWKWNKLLNLVMGQNIVLDKKTWTNFTKYLKAAMHLEFKQIQNEFKYLRLLFGKGNTMFC